MGTNKARISTLTSFCGLSAILTIKAIIIHLDKYILPSFPVLGDSLSSSRLLARY